MNKRGDLRNSRSINVLKKALLTGAIAGAGLSLMLGGSASATTIDFSTYPLFTPITTIGNATFSLMGGPGTGTPVTGSFGTASLGNSPTGDYPTAEILDVSFSSAVSNISFTFNNFGDNSSLGPSTVSAFDANGTLLGTTDVSSGLFSDTFAFGTVAGSGVTDLQFNNGTGGGSNWEFGVQQLSFDTSGVPEPTTWALMLVGFVGLGLSAKLRGRPLQGASATA